MRGAGEERGADGAGLGSQLGRPHRLDEQVAGLGEPATDDDDLGVEHVDQVGDPEGDPGALKVMHDFAWWVALGVANLVNVLDPAVVVIGGGLAEAGDLLIEPVRACYLDLVLAPGHRPPVRIVAAELGDRAGAVGAALLASADQPG